MRVVAVRGSDPPDAVVREGGSDLYSTLYFKCVNCATNNTKEERKTRVKYAHQCPITISIHCLFSFQIHPTSAIDQIAENIKESLLNNFFAANDRFRVPAERGQ